MAIRNSSGITTPTLTLAAGMVGFVFAGVVYVNNTYLTIREHQSFRDSVERDLTRLESSRLTRDEFEGWKKERDTRVIALELALHELQSREYRGITRAESEARDNILQHQVTELEARVTILNDRMAGNFSAVQSKLADIDVNAGQIINLKERQDKFAQALDSMYSQLNEALRESAALRALLPPRQ